MPIRFGDGGRGSMAWQVVKGLLWLAAVYAFAIWYSAR